MPQSRQTCGYCRPLSDASGLLNRCKTLHCFRQTLRLSEPNPYGDVTLVPPQISGYSEADLARVAAAGADARSGGRALHLRELVEEIARGRKTRRHSVKQIMPHV